MLSIIEDVFSAKTKATIAIDALLPIDGPIVLQSLVRTFGLLGFMEVLSASRFLIEVEGPKTRIDRMVFSLRRHPLLHREGRLDIAWQPYTGTFQTFRVKTIK